MSNLINSGILPLVFANEADYDKISQGDALCIERARQKTRGEEPFVLCNLTKGETYEVKLEVSERLREILLAGGLLNHTRKNVEQ